MARTTSEYSLPQVLRQRPATITNAVQHLFTMAIVLGWFHMSGTAVAVVMSTATLWLTLFYVSPRTVSRDQLHELAPRPVPVSLPSVWSPPFMSGGGTVTNFIGGGMGPNPSVPPTPDTTPPDMGDQAT